MTFVLQKLFAIEYATEPVDQAWLAEIDARYEADYQQAKAGRDAAEAARKKAVRDELAAQGRGDPKDLCASSVVTASPRLPLRPLYPPLAPSTSTRREPGPSGAWSG